MVDDPSLANMSSLSPFFFGFELLPLAATSHVARSLRRCLSCWKQLVLEHERRDAGCRQGAADYEPW